MDANKILKNCLTQVINNLDCGNSNLEEDTCLEIIEVINSMTNVKNKLSKYQACKYLHVSRSTFDRLIKDGKIPKGSKQQGFKELFWTLEDLQKCRK